MIAVDCAIAVGIELFYGGRILFPHGRVHDLQFDHLGDTVFGCAVWVDFNYYIRELPQQKKEIDNQPTQE
jgi:hypothetical protein